MIRICKMLAVAAVLAVFPLLAAAGSGETKDVGKKVDELRAAIEALTRKVDALKSDASTDRTALDDIRRRLGALERALETMQPPPPGGDRTKSYYPPPAGKGVVGRIVLRNNYGADVTLILNNNAQYRIGAFDTMEINGVPAGLVSYQVVTDGWGVLTTRTTTLEPGKGVMVTVQ